jgi:peptide/nickel transport system permease protein
MGRYILRRLLQAIPLLIILSAGLFYLTSQMGDPVQMFAGRRGTLRKEDRERLTRQLGLDQPFYVQYVVWVAGNDWMLLDLNGDGTPESRGTRLGILRGDFGKSFATQQPVLQMILERLPNTLILMITAEVVIIVLSLLIGILSATRQYSVFDNITTTASFVGYSFPIPLLAIALIYIFGVNFKNWGLPFMPTVGMFEPGEGKTIPQVLWHLVLPVAALAIVSVAGYSRYVRANMLEVMSQDYIRTARSKGLGERIILFRHALKNAALPLVTLIGLDLPFLLAGAVVTETIFSWPGMGRLFYDHTTKSDFPVLMGILMLIAFAVILFQLITDIVYTYLDPRIRYT